MKHEKKPRTVQSKIALHAVKNATQAASLHDIWPKIVLGGAGKSSAQLQASQLLRSTRSMELRSVPTKERELLYSVQYCSLFKTGKAHSSCSHGTKCKQAQHAACETLCHFDSEMSVCPLSGHLRSPLQHHRLSYSTVRHHALTGDPNSL